jgi:hypothetical protein
MKLKMTVDELKLLRRVLLERSVDSPTYDALATSPILIDGHNLGLPTLTQQALLVLIQKVEDELAVSTST